MLRTRYIYIYIYTSISDTAEGALMKLPEETAGWGYHMVTWVVEVENVIENTVQ